MDFATLDLFSLFCISNDLLLSYIACSTLKSYPLYSLASLVSLLADLAFHMHGETAEISWVNSVSAAGSIMALVIAVSTFFKESRGQDAVLAIMCIVASTVIHHMLSPIEDIALLNRHDTQNFVVAHLQGHFWLTIMNAFVAKSLLEISSDQDEKKKKKD